MAIAYFIPDQTKLLERSSGGSSSQNNTSATQSSGQPTNTTTTPTVTATSASYNNHNINNNSNNYRANITIPLNPFAPSQTHHVGCWDLITQVFCYALRFYNESSNIGSRSPLIKITVEISGGSSSDNENLPTNANTQQQQPTSQSTPRRKN